MINQLTYEKLDVKTITSGMIVHGVNCQGVMASGIAKDIRDQWSGVFKPYKEACDAFQHNRADLLGNVVYYRVNSDLVIANMFTQETYGRVPGIVYADPVAIMNGLMKVVLKAEQDKLQVYCPKIGCGLGGLTWDNDEHTENCVVRVFEFVMCNPYYNKESYPIIIIDK